LTENSYGIEKRFRFIEDIIVKSQPFSVLDFGCGTGSDLTYPLAKQFQNIAFLGVDSDVRSIKFAENSNDLPNLAFAYPQDIKRHKKFDLIIASEVIEHVDNPDELLLSLREYLTDTGKIIMTLPNGYGPFEIMTVIENLLRLTGIFDLLRKIKVTLFGDYKSVSVGNINTLSTSPHINFFSFKQVCTLFEGAGLEFVEYRPRTFLCGFIFDQLLRDHRLLNCNAEIADFLPPCLNSDWMFVLEKGQFRRVVAYRQGLFARILKYVSVKRSQKLLN
jgi:SAM-dependent methyltransferase